MFFDTDSRPGKIFRECDHIYQQLFGYAEMPILPGCRRFTATVSGVEEAGVHCACSTNDCNGNSTIDEADIVVVT